jgi:magnesium-protoporphyrin O-methyltransferase
MYDDFFGQKMAQKQLKWYLKKGVRKNSRPIIESLKKLPLEGQSLLDIGGGVGQITFELSKEGIDQVTHVDLSSGYLKTYLEEVEKRNMNDRVKTILGDFVDLHEKVPSSDIVTLDKVICCYEDYEHLIDYSSAKAKRWYAYTIPRDVWWVKVFQRLGVLIQKIRKDPFRPYVHSVALIEARLEKAGFKKIDQRFKREWMTCVFERKA